MMLTSSESLDTCFFLADNIGRHLSSTVLAELESGLASDINKLVILDIEI